MDSPRIHRRAYGRIAVAGVTTLAAASALGFTATTATAAGPGLANAPRHAQPSDPLVTEHHDADRRHGTAKPTARQRSAAAAAPTDVRWNALGTPASVGPAKALASGLSGSPTERARDYLADNDDLFGLSAAEVESLEKVLVKRIGEGTVVTLRQRFGDLPAGHDGLVSVLLHDDKVVRVTSSLARDTSAPAAATLSKSEAVAKALADVSMAAGEAGEPAVREVAVPTVDGPRAAYEVVFSSTEGAEPEAYTSFVDARSGEVLIRTDDVDHDSDNPTWSVFPATPPADGQDTRVQWCATPIDGCARAVSEAAGGNPWDLDLLTGETTNTTAGNSADNVIRWTDASSDKRPAPATDRNYHYAFTDQWAKSKCDPAVFESEQRNDADAAVSNLFAMHNRMHDFSYHLGFTEDAWNMQRVNLSGATGAGDPEIGRAQSGAISGSRNNANQGTGRDGVPPTTNMYLWQPIAGGAYPPCVDGDYDMTVIGHEYTHAITNRMIAGPDAGVGGPQGGAMGESWGDLIAGEYLFESGYRAPGVSPWVTGAYVTGNEENGIRSYAFDRSPLNYSDVGYDLVGPQVHADGEIWSATQLRVRKAFVKRYGEGSKALNEQCAAGEVDATECPGGRRWVQLMFDSFLLQATSQPSFVDMRDNMLAADLVRFGGRNQDILWNAFAESGLGRDATSTSGADTDPVPSFASAYAKNATVRLRPVGTVTGPVKLYVGDYEARSTPVADTDPATELGDTFSIVPGTSFRFVAVGAGAGAHRFTKAFPAGSSSELKLNMPRNLAASAAGASARGDGINLDKLIDETEGTNWASRDGVRGKQVTVDLAGTDPQTVKQVNVSALLRPAITGDVDDGTQNRFSALRSFAILTCDDTVSDCASGEGFQEAYRSPADAFPAGRFRPTSPKLNMRSFAIPPTKATHVRIEVVDSQCTGNPLYAGEQDNDPNAATDCGENSAFADFVRISELQVFNAVPNLTP
ncbi:peptidase M36 [Nocardioides sp. KC13]|uniref:Peptidase M36 n=1 Tax=Nocardioides turkmenicus TaxID=2711220 RepID=A0A6M1R2R6_9ACTN|nr:M36 family metallopeptidase [Nocardioides sp. KC13]NGN94514.1 peptidase M36 [Nocardioides sp. KC13]